MDSNMGNSSMTSMRTMVFTTNQDTPLYSSAWTPTSPTQYAGACIFLILLAILGRCLIASKAIAERRWLAVARNRRYVEVAGRTSESSLDYQGPESKAVSLLAAEGIQEPVKIVGRVTPPIPQPWRFSVDLPRALLFLCVAAVGYLL